MARLHILFTHAFSALLFLLITLVGSNQGKLLKTQRMRKQVGCYSEVVVSSGLTVLTFGSVDIYE